MEFKMQLPIYVQLRDLLLDRIETGEFPPGTAIQSESDLAEMYKISRLTVRSAIEELVREGYLMPVQGKGVFVVGNKIDRDLNQLSGFTRDMRKHQIQPKNNVLSCYTREAGKLFADIFQIGPADTIHYIRRVSTANGIPVALEVIYVPEDILPNLPELNVRDFSMYELYDFYGIHITHAEQTLDITTLDRNEARLLGIEVEQSVFLFTCTTYSHERPIEYAMTYVRNDMCSYQVNFRNEAGETG